MNIYKLSQSVNNDYDTYDSCVVIAEDEDKARMITPDGGIIDKDEDIKYSAWVVRPEDITVEYIGKAKRGSVSGVVCASFNAG
jgi:hypothetical protein